MLRGLFTFELWCGVQLAADLAPPSISRSVRNRSVRNGLLVTICNLHLVDVFSMGSISLLLFSDSGIEIPLQLSLTKYDLSSKRTVS